MDDAKPASHTRSQLRQAQEVVRAMARQIGVDLTIWSHVRKEMAVLEIDELDIMHALQSCRVEEVEVLGVVERCRATGRDTDGRFLRVLLVACAEQLAIEVISVEMREEEK